MKKIRYTIMAAVAGLLTFSCMKDGEMLIATLDRETGSEIMTPDGDIVLTLDKATSLALTLYWDEAGNIVLNNPDAQVGDNAVINAVQFSADENFSVFEEISVSAGQYSLQLICSQLNGILSRLGYEAGVETPLYIRIRTALGTNTESVYGEALEINVTSYHVDWSFVRLIETGAVSPDFTAFATLPAVGEEGDGEYAGFVNVENDWYNFYFMEGDNTVYGTEHDGDNGTVYSLSSTTDINSWGCWFPEGKGEGDTDQYACWYVTMSRSDMEWTAMRIREMWLQYGEGDSDNAQFEYNSGNTAWRAVFTTTAANTAVQLDEWGTLYNRTTTNDNPEDYAYTLITNNGSSQTSGTLTMGAANATTGLVIPEAGTYTLILRLADMTWELLEGEQEIATEWPEDAGYTVPGTENVFIYSLTDGTPSATAATLAKTGENIYAGFCNFTPDYTFKFGDDETPSSADKVYGAAPVSSEEANYRLYSGEDMEPISYLGSGNAFAYVTVDFDARSWSYEAVSSVSLDFNTGDDISMTGNAGVYTAEAEISSWGSGIRFSVNEAALTYTDAEPDGTLAAGEGYFTPTTDVENGHRYRITLDLNEMTYKIEDITDEEAPVYPETLYAVYAWSNGWPNNGLSDNANAAIMPAGSESGHYSGFFSSGTADNDGYSNFILCDAPASSANSYLNVMGEETRYGCVNDLQLTVKTAMDYSGDGVGACWLNYSGSNLLSGLYLIDVDLTSLTFTKTYIGNNIYVSVNGTDRQMSFSTSNLRWEATVDIAAGSTLTFKLDEAGTYTYGGADGILVKDGAGINVPEGGQYLVTVDLRDYASLKYNLASQQ